MWQLFPHFQRKLHPVYYTDLMTCILLDACPHPYTLIGTCKSRKFDIPRRLVLIYTPPVPHFPVLLLNRSQEIKEKTAQGRTKTIRCRICVSLRASAIGAYLSRNLGGGYAPPLFLTINACIYE